MIVVRGRLATTGELFFDEEPPPAARIDLLRYVQRPSPVAGARCVPFHTLVIDLTQDEASLSRGLRRTARYQVDRAATRDGLDDRWWFPADAAAIEEFCDFYDRFTPRERIARALVRAYGSHATLDLSCIGRGGERLTWHAYHRTPTRARLLFSASSFRQGAASDHGALASRANRLLHWRDMLRFRGSGVRCYDLGGWYVGRSDPKLLAIDRFKGSLGGSVVMEFNCSRAVTPRGVAALAVERLVAIAPGPVRRSLLRWAS